MDMITLHNFFEEDIAIIIDALSFTREQILGYYKAISSQVDERVNQPIWDEYSEVVKPIYDKIQFFQEHMGRSFVNVSENYYTSLMEIVASSLVVYRKYLNEIRERTGVTRYSDLGKKVDKILALDGPKKANKELFQKFSLTEKGQSKALANRKNEFFISYQTADKRTAYEIKRLLVKNSELDEKDVFVAHRNIPLSKEWREDILHHLETCTHLIAVCSNNYKCSAWGNQEVGYVMARKDVRIIPLFMEGTEKNNYGFMESFQSLPYSINEANIEQAVKDLLKKVGISARLKSE